MINHRRGVALQFGIALPLLAWVVLQATASAQWVTFANQTATRLSAPTSLGSNDPAEKDYAWADVDQDGDTDLVIVRKTPFTTYGGFANVLLLNDAGVLTDHTAQYASASLVPGSSGFLDATNDRDVVLADVTGDGWLDIVTATTLTIPVTVANKFMTHPRVYVNLGNNGSGQWQGFIYDDANRVPTMPDQPRFCAVSAGDVDQDGDVDLYLGDYQQGDGANWTRSIDLNDRLWINRGPVNALPMGYFTDETTARMTLQEVESSFGMSTKIADVNGDGFLDIVKDDALNAPQAISVTYNNPTNPGNFLNDAVQYQLAYQFTPYHVMIADLNNDGKLDLMASDDGQDKYRLNQGNDAQGRVNWGPATAYTYNWSGTDTGFDGNIQAGDLNNDGFLDVLHADIDVDIQGFTRRAHIYRNLGNVPNVTLQEQAIGGMTPSDLTGTYEFGVFDINGDGWKDLVVGRGQNMTTGTTQVWINQPPVGAQFVWTTGQPFYVVPGSVVTADIQVNSIGGVTFNAASARLYTSVNNAPYVQSTMSSLGGGVYRATFPAISCLDNLRYYVSITGTNAVVYQDPPSGYYTALGASGTTTLMDESFEGVVSGWSVINDASLSSGAWQVAVPNGTFNVSAAAAPGSDAENGAQFTKCWVTQNGSAGGSASAADVDGGPTDLLSPPLNLAGSDAQITFSRWFYSSTSGDQLVVSVSGDGVNWVQAQLVTNTDPDGTPNNQWKVSSFRVSTYITPTATTRVRFRVSDNPNNSVVEAAIDHFVVQGFV